MKRIVILLFGLLCAACAERDSLREQLDWADKEMNSRTDSVVRLLEGMERSKLNRPLRARHALLYTQALDKSKVNITNDTLIRIAVEYYARHGTPHQKALAYYYQGAVHDYAGEVDQAVEAFTYAEACAAEDDDNNLKALIYSRFGGLNLRQHNYRKAAEMYEKALPLFDSEEETNRMYVSYTLGLAQLDMGQRKAATRSLTEAQEIALKQENPHALIEIFSALGIAQIGSVYVDEAAYIKAAGRKLKEYYAKHTQDTVPASHYPYVAQILHHQGELDSARGYFTKHLERPGSRNEDDIVYYHHLSLLEWEAGNLDEALHYEHTYSHLVDSLHHAKESQLVANLEQRYLAQYAHESLRMLQTKHRYMLLSGALLFLLLAGGAWATIQRLRREARNRRHELEEFQAYAEQGRQHYDELQERYEALAEEVNLRDENMQGLYNMLGNRIEAVRDLVEMAHLYSHDTGLFYKHFKEAVKFSSDKNNDFAKDVISMADISTGGAMHYLRQHYPSLTQRELCYCACVLLGFSKESIRILYNHTNQYSIYNIQNSIRTKTGLVGQSSSMLENFLEELKARLADNREA